MTNIVSVGGGGNSSAGATWTGGVKPGNGDTAKVIGAVTVDEDTIWGTSPVSPLSGTGTISVTGTTNAVVGSGTSFTTQLKPGDVLVTAGNPDGWVIESITDNTHLTLPYNVTGFAGTAFTYRPCAVYAVGANITVAAGKKLTLRGDCSVRDATFIVGAGARVEFDSSLAAGTPMYWLNLVGVFPNIATLQSLGIAGSHAVMTSAAGSGNWRIIGAASNDYDNAYLDLSHMGSATVRAIDVGSNNGVKTKWSWQHCTFTDVWAIYGYVIPLAANWSMVGNRWFDIGAASVDILSMSFTAGVVTGSRVFTDNVAEHPLKDMHVIFGANPGSFVVERNMFGRLDTGGAGDNFTSIKHNLFLIRYSGGVLTNWNFVGTGGDTVDSCYVVEDEGPVQVAEHELMANDNPSKGGTWLYKDMVYERTTLNIGAASGDIVHAGDWSVAGGILAVQGLVAPPMSNGYGPGMVRMRGNVNVKLQVRKSTLMTQPPQSGSLNNAAAVGVGYLYAGFAGMLDQLQDCIGWAKAVWAGGSLAGFLGAYSREQGGSSVANVMNAAGYKNNAHYNASTGTLYDAAGATPTSAKGLDAFRQTTKPSLATDVDLGAGSNEKTQGPKFVDPTRNFATFDSAYLGNVAAPWADATVYAVGDIRSIAVPEFYAGATINIRCVTGHTSDAASTTKGKPGSTLTNNSTGDPSGYRQYWEFATAERIRVAIIAGTTFTDATLGLSGANIIQTLHAWARAGFKVQNSALATAASDGGVIGAMAYSAPASSARHRLRPAFRRGLRRGAD